MFISCSVTGRGRGDGGFVRQTSYEESRGEGGGGFGRGSDTRRQGWNENRFERHLVLCIVFVLFQKFLNFANVNVVK